MTIERNNTASGLPDSTEHSPEPDSPSATDHNDSQAGAASDAQRFAQIPAPAGASVYPPAAAVSSALNPRSCVTCRRRKVRCDKHMPCGNCRRTQISCIFPAPGRAPRRPRPRGPNAPPRQHSGEREVELVKRLRKLEGIVEELSGQIELEAVRHSSTDGPSPETTGDGDLRMLRRADTAQSASSQGAGSPAGGTGIRKKSPGPTARSTSANPNAPLGKFERSPTELNKNFGRLVLNDKGSSRYVSSGFWSKINDEVSTNTPPIVSADTELTTKDQRDASGYAGYD